MYAMCMFKGPHRSPWLSIVPIITIPSNLSERVIFPRFVMRKGTRTECILGPCPPCLRERRDVMSIRHRITDGLTEQKG
jgi:hypothetical protein